MQAGPDGAVLVPVKAFRLAKVRLAGALAPDERESLARTLAEGVLAAAAPLPVAVVCDDPEVAEWAAGRCDRVVWTPARGLNAAVEAGVDALAADGAGVVVVCHADLPRAADLGSLARPGRVTLAPDRRRDGTNVAAVPARAGFRFHYGPGSFAAHRAEAARLGLACEVADRPELAWDVDVPADLEGLVVGALGWPPGDGGWGSRWSR